MTALIDTIIEEYNSVFIDRRDKRVDDWLFMGSPFPTLAICLSYIFIVKVWGPQLMKDRPPYNIRYILIVYNAVQVVFSAWIFYELGMSGWFGKYSFRCEPVDYSDDPTALRFGMGGWFRGYSYRCQPVDYSDSPMALRFFFVLRKKFQNVSSLHVIHHGIMPMSVWFGVKFTPGGHSTFFGLLNSLVHIVMYFYYMMAAMGPQYQKYLWWKKHLTNIQMIQFIMIFSHAFQLCFTECNYPRAFMWWIGGHAVLFFILFVDFYKDAYLKIARNGKINYKKPLSLASIIPCFMNNDELSTDNLTNGYTNGHISSGTTKLGNGTAKLSNGYANGHSNGYASGHSNGYANGHANGYANGHANGSLTNGTLPYGCVANGHASMENNTSNGDVRQRHNKKSE